MIKEWNTEYALEQMFLVIDRRYRSRKPLIVTTNLKLEEIKNPTDLSHARIYDRIMERCATDQRRAKGRACAGKEDRGNDLCCPGAFQ